MRAAASLAIAGLAALVAASPARGQLPCIGDCGGDGTVSIADLMVGVAALLNDTTPEACVAWDPDLDFHVRVDDLVRGVARALAGPCRPSATPTATPTVPADPLLALIQPAWVEACTPLGGSLYGWSSADENGIGLYCMAGPGHDNHTTLTRYDRRTDADAAFARASAGFEPASLRDLPAAYHEEAFSPTSSWAPTARWSGNSTAGWQPSPRSTTRPIDSRPTCMSSRTPSSTPPATR